MAILTTQNLSGTTPDGTPLFQDLDLSLDRKRVGLIGRNGSDKTTLLRMLAGEAEPDSGTIRRNGVIRLLRQDIGRHPDAGIATAFGAAAELEQLADILAGRLVPDDVSQVDWTLDERVRAALGHAGLDDVELDRRLATLSGGQRMRVGLAALTFDQPDLILLDEPTNNLDRQGRRFVADLIERFPGGMLVVSHDREVLRRMERIAELSSTGIRSYGGNWDAYAEIRAAEREAAERGVAVAEREFKSVRRKIQADRERKARRDSAGKRAGRAGGDSKLAIGKRANNAQNTLGRVSRLAEREQSAAIETLTAAKQKVERTEPLSAGLPSTGLPAGRTVLSIDRATAGYDAAQPLFRDLSFTVVGPERIAVCGPNGSGKTTLFKLVCGALKPLSGTIHAIPNVMLLDQEAAILDGTVTIIENFRRLNPDDPEQNCRAALARFLFRADAALRPVSDLSGGEVIRAGLACALGGRNTPQLLLLDEPTNHLDLQSIEAVEQGLSGYDGALLIISHDTVFLEKIGIEREIALGAGDIGS